MAILLCSLAFFVWPVEEHIEVFAFIKVEISTLIFNTNYLNPISSKELFLYLKACNYNPTSDFDQCLKVMIKATFSQLLR